LSYLVKAVAQTPATCLWHVLPLYKCRAKFGTALSVLTQWCLICFQIVTLICFILFSQSLQWICLLYRALVTLDGCGRCKF